MPTLDLHIPLLATECRINMSPKYFISAYCSSPCPFPGNWEPSLEARYFKALGEIPEIQGIEHPFAVDDTRYPLSWLLQHIPSHWQMCITTVPLFMHMNHDPRFPTAGIASMDSLGQQQALEQLKQLNTYVSELNHAFGRQIVKAIHIQSFPKQPAGKSSKEALVTALQIIQAMDWQGADINIEHCDAYHEYQPPEKGLLSLEDEILAIQQSSANIGILLNWARSAIEYRSIEGPLQHLTQAMAAKLLRGFYFSGCTNLESSYGVWQDSHMPPKALPEQHYLPKTGLLDTPVISEIWQQLKDYQSCYLGIKVTNRGEPDSLERSIGLIQESIAALEFAN